MGHALHTSVEMRSKQSCFAQALAVFMNHKRLEEATAAAAPSLPPSDGMAPPDSLLQQELLMLMGPPPRDDGATEAELQRMRTKLQQT